MGKNNARITPLELYWQAGIDPKTGLPLKFGGNKKVLKEDIKKALRIIDEQDAVNRYVWYNLPDNLTSQELERMLYYKGQLCFFYDKDLEQFLILPYALDGTIDVYGRFNTVHPLPLAGGTEDKGNKAVAEYLANKHLKVYYGEFQSEDVEVEVEGQKVLIPVVPKDVQENSCVLLHDYTKQLSQTIIPRVQVNDPLLDTMAECIPMMRTSMLLATGVKGVRVQDADQAASVYDGSKSVENASLTGEAFVPIVGTVDFQELTDGQTQKAEEYMLAMQSLDNLRLSTYGIDNGGLFEKKAHELQTEADINGGPVGLVLQDGLSIRQNFCHIVSSIWGLPIWCEPAENVAGADINGDGLMYDRNENGEHSGVENNSNSAGEQDYE